MPSEEIHSLETLHSREPDSTDVQWLLGFAYYRAGRAAEALPFFQGLARDEERGAQAMYYLGAAFYQLDRNLEAIATWDQVCRIYKGSLFASKAAEHASRARTKSAT